MKQALRGAFSRVCGRLYLTQWLGNILLMLLGAGWLQIPDSHTWQFVFSMLSGVLLVLGFLWLYTSTFRRLRTCPAPVSPARPDSETKGAPSFAWFAKGGKNHILLSWLLLVVFVVLWWLELLPIAAVRAHEGLYAGYWNSQSPPWLRHHLGYSQLVAWQERIYDCLQCLWAGLLLPLAVETCACGLGAGWFRRAARVYRHWLYWLTVLVCGLGGSAITWALADWTPLAGLAGQTLSIVARLGLAYSLDILLWCFLLALVAYYLKDESA
jgi:hypothetical protein